MRVGRAPRTLDHVTNVVSCTGHRSATVGRAPALNVQHSPSRAMSARFHSDAIALTGEIMTTAMRLTSSREDAEDLTQEVMLRAYAGFGSFRGGTSLRSWL